MRRRTAAGCSLPYRSDMGWSEEALSLRRPTVVELPRAADRISFLFLDRAKVWQDDTGVKAVHEDASILSIPVAGLSTLMLGPGCSITTPAMTTLHRAGCSITVVDGAGTTAVVPGRRLSTRARWSEAQATVWADHDLRVLAARQLYRSRFGEDVMPEGAPLNVMRGVEGRLVRRAYGQAAKQAGLKKWRRDTASEDPANRLLNLANSILYGAALAATSALGLNPALGFVHEGAADALLFDLADNDKATTSIPTAFACAQLPAEDQARELRRRMRGHIHRKRVIAQHLKLLDVLLGGHARTDAGDVAGDRLIGETPHASASGHTSHRVPRDHDHDLPF